MSAHSPAVIVDELKPLTLAFGGRASAPSPSSSDGRERELLVFLIFWTIAGLLQSIFTSLTGEEAYYALFGQRLAWGYFDHPPGIALVARIGMLLFHGNLGPRLMIVILSTATIWLGSRLLAREHLRLYILTISAMALVHLGSFFVKTDVPLLFFEAMFFYCYREYIRRGRWFAGALLPLAIAGMLLSKYPGILVIGFTLLSNLSIVRRLSFWLITFVAAVLFLPHVAWQYTHHFVTVDYQLFGRTDSGFHLKNVIEYVVMQPVVFGPAVGFLLLPIAWRVRAEDQFERALKFNLIGVLVFFLVASFHGHIHLHWTSIALIPLLALAIPRIAVHRGLRNLLIKLALGTIVILVPLRVYLAWDFLPASVEKHIGIVHGWNLWAEDIHHLAGGRHVVFVNDYQDASLYSYYTGEMAGCYNSLKHHPSQQNLWGIDDQFRGTPAMIVNAWRPKGFDRFVARNGAEFRYAYVNDFQSYTKVEIQLLTTSILHCTAGTPLQARIRLINHYDHPVTFRADPELSPVITYHFFVGHDIAFEGVCDSKIVGTTVADTIERTVTLRAPRNPGHYVLHFAIRPGWLPPSLNSQAYPVTVRQRTTRR